MKITDTYLNDHLPPPAQMREQIPEIVTPWRPSL
jgi:hypothetical protein